MQNTRFDILYMEFNHTVLYVFCCKYRHGLSTVGKAEKRIQLYKITGRAQEGGEGKHNRMLLWLDIANETPNGLESMLRKKDETYHYSKNSNSSEIKPS